MPGITYPVEKVINICYNIIVNSSTKTIFEEVKFDLKEWIWDGEMDCGWEDLSALLINTCNEFSDVMLKTTEISPHFESKEMISAECMKRFESIVGFLSKTIKDGIYYECEDINNNVQNALKLNSWILLGSLTETILQMFLAFYICDYKKAKWMQWEEFEIDIVQKPIVDCIRNLVDQKSLNKEQADSLKKAIKDKIKEHTIEHPVQKVMLDELIQFYRSLDLFDDDDIFNLKQIQSNRNGIHSFQQREIGTWMDLQYSVRFFCYLMDWVMGHLPDVPDYEEY